MKDRLQQFWEALKEEPVLQFMFYMSILIIAWMVWYSFQ